MKTMKYFLSMAALALVGAMTVSCSSDDNIIDQPQQPETKNNVVTLTTTVGLGGDDATRALTSTGVKTFAVGETMALRYKNTKGDWVKAVSNALEAEDIAVGSKSATFTFTLTNPDKTQNVDYIYPAAIVNQSGNMNEAALFGSQDGTLNTIASTFDYSRKVSAWDGENLPSLTLENQLAILAITLKNADGSSNITSTITGLTISDGTKTYNVTPSAAEGPIYVAIFPTEDATITVTATDGTKNYAKTLFGKTYAKGNGYPVRWTMAKVVAYSSEMNVPAGDHWYIGGSGTQNINIGEGATVTIGSFLQVQDASIICSGNATIILADGTTTNIFNGRIKAGPEGTTLTIKGNTGELNIQAGKSLGAAIGASDGAACGNIEIQGGIITAKGAMAAGIGASTAECGNITISGGTVTATASDTGGAGIGSGSSDRGWCGDITISGGTVEATGGFRSAGIGTGEENGCGDITIKSTVTHVTATKGSGASASIGAANDEDAICGEVTIEDPSKVTQN
jgi:hypothetical protein